jgi:hypothetical protein
VVSYHLPAPRGIEPVRQGSGLDPDWNQRIEGSAVSDVRLTVYDVLGREVAVLVNERKPAGDHTVKFDGSGLATGVHLCRLMTGSFVQTKKMILLK